MRLIARRTRVSSLLTACALAFGLAPRSAAADAPPVTIGEVSAHVPSGEFGPALRTALEDELAAHGDAKPPRAALKFVLSATLVKLSAEQKNGTVRATAVVSVVLRRARDSSLHAILSGSATAEEDSSLESTRETALRAAVRGALRG